jgi:hypothetical protein
MEGYSDDDRATFARFLTRFVAGMDNLAQQQPGASPHHQARTQRCP